MINNDKWWTYLVVLAAVSVAVGFMLFLEFCFENGLATYLNTRSFSSVNANPLAAFIYSLPDPIWIGIQIVGLIVISLGIGALTFEVTKKYKLLAALTATVTPSVFFWVPSATGEIPLLATSAWGMLFLVKYINSGQRFHAVVAGALFAMALASRGTLILFPVAGLSILIITKMLLEKKSFGYALRFSGIPFAIPLLFVLGMSAHNYSSTGYWYWSSQSGTHLLQWVYPCLKNRYGCGIRDMSLVNELKQELALKMAAEGIKGSDIGAKNQLQKSIAWERLHQEEKLSLVIAGLSSYVKILVYSPVRLMLGSQGIVQGALWNSSVDLGAQEGSREWRRVGLTIAEVINLMLLIIQGCGLIVLLANKNTREIDILFGIFIVAVLATGLGIGNPRYSAVTLVVFIPLFFVGVAFLKGRLRNH